MGEKTPRESDVSRSRDLTPATGGLGGRHRQMLPCSSLPCLPRSPCARARPTFCRGVLCSWTSGIRLSKQKHRQSRL
eukprot:4148522-Alexandrium_andersonii.AAC.1